MHRGNPMASIALDYIAIALVLREMVHAITLHSTIRRTSAVLCSLLVFYSLSRGVAHGDDAPTRRFGDCINDGFFCFGPSATISVADYDLKAHRTKLGFIPGIGYGVNFFADKSYALGASIYLAVSGDSASPTVITPSIIFSFAEYVRFGIGFTHVDATDTVPSSMAPQLFFGFGVDLGTTPTSRATSQVLD